MGLIIAYRIDNQKKIKMKKLLLGLIALMSVQSGWSQDGGSEAFDKKFRFGLRIDPALCWYTPDNQKKFENGGMGL